MFRYLAIALLISVVSCEMTDVERGMVQSTWAKHHTGDPTEQGVDIFYTFFSKYPQYKDEFPKFKGVSMADLKSNADFRAHATKIFHVVDDAVVKKNWADVDTLSQFHHDLGKTNKVPYNAFRQVFMEWMHLDADQTVAWTKALDVFFQHFYSHF